MHAKNTQTTVHAWLRYMCMHVIRNISCVTIRFVTLVALVTTLPLSIRIVVRKYSVAVLQTISVMLKYGLQENNYTLCCVQVPRSVHIPVAAPFTSTTLGKTLCMCSTYLWNVSEVSFALPEIAIQTAVITLIPFIATLTPHTIQLSWKRQEPLLTGKNHWLTYSRAQSDNRCSLCF